MNEQHTQEIPGPRRALQIGLCLAALALPALAQEPAPQPIDATPPAPEAKNSGEPSTGATQGEGATQPEVTPPGTPQEPVQTPEVQPAEGSPVAQSPNPPTAPNAPAGDPAAPQDPPAPADAAPSNVAPPVVAAEAAPAKAVEPSIAEPAPAPRRVISDLATVASALERIAADHAGLARPLDMGTLADGRRVPALLFGADGPLALDARPCVLLLGGLDGEGPSGGEAVLRVASDLMREPASLPPGVAFVAVPWASPEAIELSIQGRSADGRNAQPLDEDRDGRVDEDGADDLDGDGAILQMLIEDPEGPWVRSQNQRLLARARPGDAPRYTLSLEGKDDDGDGRFNEDGPGGIVLDLHFPVGRVGPWVDGLGGALPLSDDLARRYADFALARRAAIVILFQGNHGRLALPGGSRSTSAPGWMRDSDRAVYERVHALFLGATTRRAVGAATLLECRGRERRGAALDWFYSTAGALAVEIAPWGPALDSGGEANAENARFDTARRPTEGVPAEDLAWARWIDDTRGGLGFIDWHPVDVGQGRQALVGGWEPGTRTTPPPEHLERALAGLCDFTRRLAASLPRLELRLAEASRDGDVCRIRARLANGGVLPTGMAISDSRAGSVGAWVELELPAGAKLIAGEPRCEISRLAGGGISRECEWIVVAPQGSTFTLRAGSDWSLAIGKEVKP